MEESALNLPDGHAGRQIKRTELRSTTKPGPARIVEVDPAETRSFGSSGCPKRSRGGGDAFPDKGTAPSRECTKIIPFPPEESPKSPHGVNRPGLSASAVPEEATRGIPGIRTLRQESPGVSRFLQPPEALQPCTTSSTTARPGLRFRRVNCSAARCPRDGTPFGLHGAESGISGTNPRTKSPRRSECYRARMKVKALTDDP